METDDEVRELQEILSGLQKATKLPLLMNPTDKFAFSRNLRGIDGLRKWVEARLAELWPAAAAAAAVPPSDDGEDNPSYRDGCMF